MGLSDSAPPGVAALPSTPWHCCLLPAILVHVPVQRGLTHPGHVTSFRINSSGKKKYKYKSESGFVG